MAYLEIYPDCAHYYPSIMNNDANSAVVKMKYKTCSW